MLTKQDSILGKGTWVERGGEPRRTQERVGEPISDAQQELL